MDSDLIITLLTITVILLSLVIVTMLVALTFVLLKLNEFAKEAKRLTRNVSEVTAWMSPYTVFKAAKSIFSKK
jgi:hypothetical protein